MKYFDASLSLIPTPKNTYRGNFQQKLNEEFYNSSDWWTIQQETYFGSGEYEDIDVRMNEVISNETGSTPSDDFKILLFKDIEHLTALGWLYYFDNNFWICVNTEKTKTLTATATVKRCQNVLKWMDEQGVIYQYPFTLGDYLIRENRNYATAGSALVIPSGTIEVHTQFNTYTNKIKPNQRFLLGNPDNWHSYRVQGGGINNINRLQTNDPMSVGLLKLTMNVDYQNYDTDDLTNGIPDKAGYNYEVIVQNGYSLSVQSSTTLQLDAYVTLNNSAVTRTLEYSSTDDAILTVNSSGLVSFVSNGTAKVRVQLYGNEYVYKEVTFVVSSTPVIIRRVSVTPDVNYVLLGDETEFEVQLLTNGVITPTSFTYSVTPNTVPTANYTITSVDGNHFRVKNNAMFLTDKIDILCTNGTYNTTISIYLKGGW